MPRIAAPRLIINGRKRSSPLLSRSNMEAPGSTPPIRPPEPQSPSAGSESGKSDTSSAKRKWKATIASLPPLLPTQQQVTQQLLETDSRELRKQRVIDPDAVYSKLWDVLVLIILLFNAAMIPYRIAFLSAYTRFIRRALRDRLYMRRFIMARRNHRPPPRLPSPRPQGDGHHRDTQAIHLYSFSFYHTTFFIYLLSLSPIDTLEITSPSTFYLRGGLRINRLLLTPRVFTLLRELGDALRLDRHRVMLVRLLLLTDLNRDVLPKRIVSLHHSRGQVYRPSNSAGGSQSPTSVAVANEERRWPGAA